MNIITKATNMELTDKIREYAIQKIRSVEKMIKNNKNGEAVITLRKTSNHHKSGEVYSAEVNMEVDGKSFRAVSETADIHSSIDDVRDELMREVTSQKNRTMKLMRKGAKKIKDTLRFWR